MPSYDYHCPANGQTIEVKHRMSESIATWGELCQLANMVIGDTPSDTPVQRKISSTGFVSTSSSKLPPMGGGGCGSGCGCHG